MSYINQVRGWDDQLYINVTDSSDTVNKEYIVEYYTNSKIPQHKEER